MIELKNNQLVFQFPEVHKDASCRVTFQRTLRIPDDNREYPLPPGLGNFPMEHVEDHSSRLPREWTSHGGVLLPMYQAEALWVNFSTGPASYPFAIKIAAGKINAITGLPWTNELAKDPQDYVVAPGQPWLDGFCVRKGLIRQFVAMPLGQGYTAEEQLTGTAEHGGLQIVAYPMKPYRYEAILAERDRWSGIMMSRTQSFGSPMGLAPGGLMRQEIFRDEYGVEAWDTASSRCFVHILNSSQWKSATGKSAPHVPPSSEEYTKAGLPWFDYYDDKLQALPGTKKLAALDSVAAKGVKLGEKPLPDNEAVKTGNVIRLGLGSAKVKDGRW